MLEKLVHRQIMRVLNVTSNSAHTIHLILNNHCIKFLIKLDADSKFVGDGNLTDAIGDDKTFLVRLTVTYIWWFMRMVDTKPFVEHPTKVIIVFVSGAVDCGN